MTTDTKYEGFSTDERAAMKERAAELKKAGRAGSGAKKAAADLQDCLDKIAALPDDDRAIAEKLHEIVTTTAPDLAPKTWYGFPSYARDGKVVIFLKPASKFGMRYAELGFNETAQLDDGDLWPTVYAVKTMNAAVAKQVTALVKKAAG